jgi:hypothetical protein
VDDFKSALDAFIQARNAGTPGASFELRLTFNRNGIAGMAVADGDKVSPADNAGLYNEMREFINAEFARTGLPDPLAKRYQR